MTPEEDHTAAALEVLKRAVSEALDRKRRLGQNAVVWRDGRVVLIGPDGRTMPTPPEE